MGTKTGIEWTDSTWSPIRVRVKQNAAEIARAKGYTSLVPIAEKMAGRVGPHCEHVSPGCANCYAETNNHRCLPANGTGLPYDRRSRDMVEALVDKKALLQPLRWRPITGFKILGNPSMRTLKKRGGIAMQTSRPRRIFVENQSDLFGEWVTDEMLDQVFAIMALCPQHTFQVLTKRPERMRSYFEGLSEDPDAVGRAVKTCHWLTTDVLNRIMTDEEFDALIELPKGLPNVWLGVSVENQDAADERIPLLLQTPAAVRFLSCEPLLGPVKPWLAKDTSGALTLTRIPNATSAAIDWVICGGESGPGAREMKTSWARSLRDQCAQAGVPFFFKQWGQWVPTTDPRVAKERGVSLDDCMTFVPRKKDAGAQLDGREWKQFPGGR